MNVMSEKQAALFQLAVSFDQACKKLNVKYSLACGTLLGCVREKGFIPWDDDFDIMMSVSDYNKMAGHYKRFHDQFRWVSCESENDSPLVYARIYPKDVSFDSLEKYPYIDIHVYVPADDHLERIRRDLKRVDFLTKLYWVKKRKYHRIFHRKKSLIGAACQLLLIPLSSERLRKAIGSYEKKYPAENTKMMPVQGFYGIKEVLDQDALAETQPALFEGHPFLIIQDYDDYLRNIYGDYMTPVKYNH